MFFSFDMGEPDRPQFVAPTTESSSKQDVEGLRDAITVVNRSRVLSIGFGTAHQFDELRSSWLQQIKRMAIKVYFA